MRKIVNALKFGKVVEIPFTYWESFAMYPFIFVKKGSKYVDRYVINHERIHIQQQKETYLFLSLPLLIISLVVDGLSDYQLLFLFLPTILYYAYWLITFVIYGFTGNNRLLVCYEKEAALNQYNMTYIKTRSYFSNILYL